MRSAQVKAMRMLLVAALVLGAAFGLAAVDRQQAHAYSYLNTYTGTIFSRHWIRADPSGYFEEIGADPHASRVIPSEWSGYVKQYRFSMHNATVGRDWWDYYGHEGSWERGGARFGHGVFDGSANGTGFGCVATHGYAWSSPTLLASMGGFDMLYYSHVWINDSVWGNHFYSAADFWPRVKIQYDANGGSGAPGSHYKYIGNAGAVSSSKPSRTGYTFEGWSTVRSGPVNIASAQTIGYEDWNLKKHMTVAHGWDNGPANVTDDPMAGQPSPTGSNVITLYAQWKPIVYNIAYSGNGATAGSTASSSHVYDAPKALTANGFARSYALSCDAQGGSAGNVSLSCAWSWKSWNTAANGSGRSFANRASIVNLRSIAGTSSLYAQWQPGTVALPDPGAKPGCSFGGWYSSATGGVLVGSVGDPVSIAKDTTYYARWRLDAKIAYHVDGSSAPLFSETVPAGTEYRINDRATILATREECERFDGWYLDQACTLPFVSGSVVSDAGLDLYGRNKVVLRYDAADRTRSLFADRMLFSDEERATAVSVESLLPRSRTLDYGTRVFVERGQSVWLEERDRMREAVCEPGAYAVPSATEPAFDTIRLTANTVVYLQWALPTYDGIALS